MTSSAVEIHTFPDDGQWKLYRDRELVAVYGSKAAAEAAAKEFATALQQSGKSVELHLLDQKVLDTLSADDL
jgi:hypothetical protein